MLKLLNLFLGLILILILGLFLVLKVGPSYAVGKIETYLAQNTGIKVKISGLHIKGLWPTKVAIKGVRFDGPQFLGRISESTITISHPGNKWLLSIEVLEPQIRLKPMVTTSSEGPAAVSASGGGGANAPSGRIVDLNFNIKNGQIDIPEQQLLLDEINLQVKKENIADLRLPAKIDLKSKLQMVAFGLHLQWPLSVQINDLLTNGEYFKTQTAKIALGGLTLGLIGESNLRERTHHWQAKVDVPKIEDLPQPPKLIPGANFKGQVKIETKIDLVKDLVRASGSVWLRDFSGDLRIKQDGLDLEGQVKSTLDTSFSYDQGLRFPHFNLSLDLSAARLQYKDLLHKDHQVPLKVEVKGSSPEQILKIENAIFEIAQIRGQLQGTLSPATPYQSSLALQIQPTSLAGLEKVVLPLRSSPVEGRLDLRMVVVGPLADWKKAKIDLQALNILGGKGRVEWKNAESGMTAIGPVTVKITGSGLYENEKFVRANSSGLLDLSQLSIQAKDFYQKTALEPMRLDFDFFAPGLDLLQLRKMSMVSRWGELSVIGKIAKPLEPEIEVDVKATRISLNALKKSMPLFKDKLPDGYVDSNLKIKGIYRFAESDWYKQNIRVSGSVSAQMAEYKMESKSAGGGGGNEGKVPAIQEPVQGFLPEGLLTQNLDLSTTVKIQKLTKESLVAEEVSSVGRVQKGIFSGQASIKKIFSGSLSAEKLKVPLLERQPKISGLIQVTGIDIEESLGFAKPEFKNWAKGKISGKIDFVTLMPDAKDFLDQLALNGKMVAESLVLNSVQMGKMISDLVKKVPFLGSSSIKMDSLEGRAEGTFAFKDQSLNLSQFRAIDKDGSELSASGTVFLKDMTMNMKGLFWWQNPSVKGCIVEGNRDEKGRMKIPLQITGSLTSPSYSLVGNLVSELGANALKCEKNKFVEKIKKDGVKKLQEEVKDKLKGLFGN